MSRVLILIAAAFQAMAPAGGTMRHALGADLIFVPPVPDDQPAPVGGEAECLALDQVRATRIIAGTGIVYKVSNHRQFINRVRGQGDALADGQVLHIRSKGPLLCAGDVVYLLDGLTGASVSFVGLGRFERYDAPVARRR